MSISKLDNLARIYAFEHLGETREAIINGLKEMKEFITSDEMLKNIKINEIVIIYFLRTSKFRIETAKKKIKSHYTCRMDISEWFSYRDPFLPTINELLELGVFLPVIEKDENNRQILILRVAAHDPKKHNQNDIMKVSLMVFDWLTYNDEITSVYGTRAIFDLKNVQLGHAMQMTPSIIKRAVQLMESYPTRIQQLYFVNAHKGINVILDIFKKFMSQKMRNRIFVTKNNPEYNASDNLPKELGGTNKSYEELSIYWKNKLENNHKWFNEN